MHVASISNLRATADDRVLFDELSFGLDSADRVGVVGSNGAGKSTLLRILAGTRGPDGGQVVFTTGARVGMLSQAPDLGGGTALEVVLGSPDLGLLEHEAEAMLAALGVPLDLPVTAASGGQRRRVALARTLVSPTDLLILDEPTNHLDVETVEWLEEHLRSRPGGIMMVTHDRYVLDRLANRMLELHPDFRGDGRGYWHDGTYADVLEARLERERQATAREARRANLARKELAWLRRGPKARTSKARFRVEQAEGLQVSDMAAGTAPLELGTGRHRLGDKVIEVEDLSFTWPDGPRIVDGLDLALGRGDRLGLVGVNGAGKTTLLRLLTGELEPDRGLVVHGSTVHLATYEQEAMTAPSDVRVLDTILEVGRSVPLANGDELTASDLAERFGFDNRLKAMEVNRLSGGERRRLALLHLLVRAPNVIVLDEPTNDLDLDTLRALEDHLDGFAGTLVVASHDRFLLDRLTDELLVVQPGGVVQRALDWGDYRRRFPRAAAPTTVGSAAVADSRQTGDTAQRNRRRQERRKELGRLERRMGQLTEQRSELEAQLAAAATDFERLRALDEQLREVRAELDDVETTWLELAEDLA